MLDNEHRFRFVIHKSKTSSKGKHAIGFGLCIGHWPCSESVFIQLRFGIYVIDWWHGMNPATTKENNHA